MSDIIAEMLLWLARMFASWSTACEKGAKVIKQHKLRYVVAWLMGKLNRGLVWLAALLDEPYHTVFGNETKFPNLDFSAPTKVRAVVRLALALIDSSPDWRVQVSAKDQALARAIAAGQSLDSSYVLELFEFFTKNNEETINAAQPALYLQWFLYGGQAGRNWVATCVNMIRQATLDAGRMTATTVRQ